MAEFGNWEPIETAPKDGRKKFIFANVLTDEIFIGIRPIGCPDDAASDMFGSACYPSHWMPLPPAPTQESGDEC